jgi:hypothetical protein
LLCTWIGRRSYHPDRLHPTEIEMFKNLKFCNGSKMNITALNWNILVGGREKKFLKEDAYSMITIKRFHK